MGDYCTIASPILPTKADVAVISPKLTGELVTSYCEGVRLCHWPDTTPPCPK